jgi:uncharacterized caspase-like protein
MTGEFMFTGGTRHQCLLVGLLLVLTSVSFPAFAEKRFALLIGNEAYESAIGRLGNPHNDVALLEQALKGLGFEVAVERDDGLGALTRAVNAYVRRLHVAGPNVVGFFYYSGHGASDGTTNYLIPVDVKTTETGELWDQSLQLTEITRKLKKDAANATHFVVFDACRNTLKLTHPGSRALVQPKGFVPVAQESGMLIAYSTEENELASDLGAGAGPYAKVLAEEIIKPGIEAVSMFRVVQRRVRVAISQEPYLGFSALGDVYLGGKPDTARPSPPQTTAGLTYEQQAELTFWSTVKDSKDPAVLQVYLDKYPSGMFADLARQLIAQAKRESEARRAEAAERAAQTQRAEAERKARDAEAGQQQDQLRKALEEARLAREAFKTAEADRLAAEKAAQEARRSAEALAAALPAAAPTGDPVTREKPQQEGAAAPNRIPPSVFFRGVVTGWSLTTNDMLIGRDIYLFGGTKLGPIRAVILNGSRERVGVVVAAEEKEVGIRLPALKLMGDRITLNVERPVVTLVPPFDRCEAKKADCRRGN